LGQIEGRFVRGVRVSGENEIIVASKFENVSIAEEISAIPLSN